MTAEKRQAAYSVRWLRVDADHSGQRLDNFLLANLKGVPRSHIYQIVRKGEVRINKGRSRPDYRLRAGDVVRIPPIRTAMPKPDAPVTARRRATLVKHTLFEDGSLMVIDKPSGMAVHGGSGINFGVIETLRGLFPQARFLELVHRLDRETSGCLVVAKKRSALTALHRLLREAGSRGMDKRYLALVMGHWKGGTRKVQVSLERSVLHSGERLVKVTARGKESFSIFAPQRIYGKATLVEVRLITGRTHQARVHAAHLGYPIAGDEKYGNREFNLEMKKLGLKRLFLHAAEVSFKHPLDGAELRVQAPLPAGLTALLKRLQSDDEEKV